MAKTRQNASSSENSNSNKAIRKKSLRQVQGQPLRRSGRISKPTLNVERRGAGAPKSGQPDAKIPLSTAQSSPKTPISTVQSSRKMPTPAVQSAPKTPTPAEEKTNQDEGWISPDYNDVEWLYREAHRCQSCNKTFDNAIKPALCITSHKVGRCYFCFTIYKSKDDLFEHFGKCHKLAGRENTLVCHFCDRAVLFKSVSCHVICEHLGDMAAGRAITKS